MCFSRVYCVDTIAGEPLPTNAILTRAHHARPVRSLMSPSYVICGFKLFFYRPLMSAELCSVCLCVEKVGHTFFLSMFYTSEDRRQIFSICKSKVRARTTLLLKRSRNYLTRPDVKRMWYSIGRRLIHHVCGCTYVCVCTRQHNVRMHREDRCHATFNKAGATSSKLTHCSQQYNMSFQS